MARPLGRARRAIVQQEPSFLCILLYRIAEISSQQLGLVCLLLMVVLRKVTSCEAPITVFHNRYGTMSPTLSSGDMLFTTNYPDDPITVGDIVLVKFPEEILVRRVVSVEQDYAGNLVYLTKGDNIDSALVTSDPTIPRALTISWVSKDRIVGKMIMNVPFVGIPSLILFLPKPHLVFLLVMLSLAIRSGRTI